MNSLRKVIKVKKVEKRNRGLVAIRTEVWRRRKIASWTNRARSARRRGHGTVCPTEKHLHGDDNQKAVPVPEFSISTTSPNRQIKFTGTTLIPALSKDGSQEQPDCASRCKGCGENSTERTKFGGDADRHVPTAKHKPDAGANLVRFEFVAQRSNAPTGAPTTFEDKKWRQRNSQTILFPPWWKETNQNPLNRVIPNLGVVSSFSGGLGDSIYYHRCVCATFKKLHFLQPLQGPSKQRNVFLKICFPHTWKQPMVVNILNIVFLQAQWCHFLLN